MGYSNGDRRRGESGRGGLLLHLTELSAEPGNIRLAGELVAECYELYSDAG